MKDEIEDSLRDLSAEGADLAGRKDLSEAEKDKLILEVGGPLTAANIRKALKSHPKRRIPFVFSSLNPQHVLDIMENDMTAAIERARLIGKPRKFEPPR